MIPSVLLINIIYIMVQYTYTINEFMNLIYRWTTEDNQQKIKNIYTERQYDDIESSCRSKSQCANIAVFDPSYTSRHQLIKSNGSLTIDCRQDASGFV